MTNPYINNCSYTPPNQNTTDQEWWMKDALITLGSFFALCFFSILGYGTHVLYKKCFDKLQKIQTEDTQSGGTKDSLKIDKKPAEHINKSFTNDEHLNIEFFTTIKTNPSDTEVVGDTATTTIDVPEQ
ncbi:hypothetical protein [Rickettsia endosymbiont of Culicoides newsteadi]|uniref:hypothetical protein n=1 Tax=Rickettsia endosymbiont of Culicoides newsteadi TaxID=1961830 RepID=UPI000B9C3F04|nr:hypothetical protein [Rickettsia endosymbiont of Culicoides newsteadi]OZG31375.1 hypothetical protein RiCNE_12300 [Rickettsia endosymbiont of Culicoides newsteadi]